MHAHEKVWANNPRTHQMELESVLHVWINHDNDLVDLTLTVMTPAVHGKPAIKTSEVIHTNKKHPFLTREKGFVPKLGMHVRRADATYGVVTGWKVVPGISVMYNLEVAQDHTFTVGTGQWVVHNCGGGNPENVFLPQNRYPETASHIRDAVEDGKPAIQHIARDLADANRDESLQGWPTQPGMDRDEYPMAMT